MCLKLPQDSSGANFIITASEKSLQQAVQVCLVRLFSQAMVLSLIDATGNIIPFLNVKDTALSQLPVGLFYLVLPVRSHA